MEVFWNRLFAISAEQPGKKDSITLKFNLK